LNPLTDAPCAVPPPAVPVLHPYLRHARGYVLGLLALLGVLFAAPAAHGQGSDPADQVCARLAPGSALPAPPDLYSSAGTLEVTFMFQTVTDQQGLVRYCYVTPDGLEAPTLHVNPGDQLIIHLQNLLPPAPAPAGTAGHAHHAHPAAAATAAGTACTSGPMGPDVTNLHFHGMNVPPTCHQDEVISTLVQPAETFDYTVQIPADEPPGLYWYHPHPHGYSEGQVLGGATGALIVGGIETVNPLVAGLTQRVFVVREQRHQAQGMPPAPGAPYTDLSVNFVPVTYPGYVAPVLQTPAGTREFWRVANATAETYLDLALLVNGVAQPLQIVAIDGVAVGQAAGNVQTLTDTHYFLPAGARVEFLVTTPTASDTAQLVTQAYTAGLTGGNFPQRPLASISATGSSPMTAAVPRGRARTAHRVPRFAGLATTAPNATRTLYFSEGPMNAGGYGYFITVAGQAPKAYEMGDPPALVLHQGTVEDWTVENQSSEDHVFHIHQLHFQVLAVNGVAVSDPALRDTVNVPGWTGSGPYPSVTLRLDFRDPQIVGTFVYHCHLLDHEDRGMMAALQLLPAGTGTTTALTASLANPNVDAPVTLRAVVTPAASGAAPGGSVQFALDGTPLGTPVAVSNGQADYPLTFSRAGSHTLTAAYSGDANYNESLSGSVAVAAQDFTLSAGAVQIPAGAGSGSAPVTVAGTSGFDSTVALTCTVGGTFAAKCALAPAQLSGSGSATLTCTVSTSARLEPRPAPMLAGVPLLGAAAGFMRELFRRRRPRSRPAGTRGPLRSVLGLAALLLLATVLLSPGCGDSYGGPTPGSYTVTVKATAQQGSATLVHSTDVAVQVL